METDNLITKMNMQHHKTCVCQQTWHKAMTLFFNIDFFDTINNHAPNLWLKIKQID